MTEPIAPPTPPVADTPAPGAGGSGKTFTQEQLDTIIEQRLNRERGKFADYDDLRAKAEKLTKLEQEQMTEAERQKQLLAEAQAAKAGLEAQLKTKELETQGLLVRAEVRVMATSMGFASPDDAYALANLAKVKVAESGEISGVKEALEKLTKGEQAVPARQTHPSDGTGTPRRAAPGAAPPVGTTAGGSAHSSPCRREVSRWQEILRSPRPRSRVLPEQGRDRRRNSRRAITAGQAVSIPTAGKAQVADANDAGQHQFRGIALTGGGAGQAISVLKKGHCYGSTLTGSNADALIYLSDTAGVLSDTVGTMTVPVGRVICLTDAN